VDAVRFGTLNNARRLAIGGIREAAFLGALAPGMVGDVVLVADPLKAFDVQMVLHEGKVVAARGTVTVPAPQPRVPEGARHTVEVDPVTEETFTIAAPAGAGRHVRVRAFKLPKPPALPFPSFEETRVTVKDGALDTDGYAIIAVFNRYGGVDGGPVLGLIKNYSLENGAVASTLAHDSHNLIALGTNPADMATAVNAILETQGGMAAVRDGEMLAQLAFPVGGLMTTDPADVIARDAKAFRQAIATLGLDPSSPILPFAIFSLPVAPGDKVTDRGLWDAEQEALVSLFVEEA
jgi:adenine deaminase